MSTGQIQIPTLNIGHSFILEIAPGYEIQFTISDIDIDMGYEAIDISDWNNPRYIAARREFTASIRGINVQ